MSQSIVIAGHIPTVDNDIIAALADTQGKPKSVILRRAISAGLAAILDTEPELAERYKTARAEAERNLINSYKQLWGYEHAIPA